MLRDHSIALDPAQEKIGTKGILKSKLLAVTSIFFRQMHEMVYLPDTDKYQARLTYKQGSGSLTVCQLLRQERRV